MIDVLMNFDVCAVMPVQSVAGRLEAGTLRAASSRELRSAVYLARPTKVRETLLTQSLHEMLTSGLRAEAS